jgi:hypothetical protein
MVEVTTVIRGAKAKERLKILKNAQPQQVGIRVEPRDETIRKYIKHQPRGIAFRPTGSIEWPNDRFTQRRLLDGTVKLAEEPKEEKSKTAAKPATT